jgi:hypothetical protein
MGTAVCTLVDDIDWMGESEPELTSTPWRMDDN